MSELDAAKKEISFHLENLLKASLFAGDAARQAFIKWEKVIDFDQLDSASYQFLPKLYPNLQKLKIEHRLLPKIKGIYRKTWIENQLFTESLREVFSLLEEQKINLVVTSCVLRIARLEADRNVFSLDGLTISISATDAPTAIKLLRENGWLPDTDFDFRKIAPNDFVRLTKANQHHLVFNWLPNANFENLRQASEKINFANKETNILSAEEQILQICRDEFLSVKKRDGRWIFFAYLILQNKMRIDWKAVVAAAKNRRMCFALRLMLDYLREEFGASIPLEILNELKAAAKPKILSAVFPQNSLAAFESLRMTYRKQSMASGKQPTFAGFYIFLQNHWNVTGVLPVAREIAQRLRQLRRISF